MSDRQPSEVTPPAAGTPAGPGRTVPDARGESAVGTAPTGGAPHATDPGRSVPSGGRLLPREECDKLGLRLQQAVSGFVDAPRDAVEEADRVLEEITARLTEALAGRRRTLRASWQTAGAGGGEQITNPDTEQLRLALRDYRELADRLMHL
ncbi:hypothetical protein [Streptomyces glaucus]|uniref:Secreted protein n=1 Tax=Streptomyces glaucus TaxID=284029 RepID=A0ABN3KGS1_9ACTN